MRLNALIPHPSDFAHVSRTHGQAHVGRVMIHAFRLIEATGLTGETSRLWGAVYVHDLARTHDGFDETHGREAVMRVNESTDLQERLIAGGVPADDVEMLLAVMFHCLPDDHAAIRQPMWPALKLLKDANGLDRVRFNDLDPAWLRFPEAKAMAKFAQDLYSQSHRRVKEGPNFFTDLLRVAERILGKPVPIPAVLSTEKVGKAPVPTGKGAPAAGKPGAKAAAGKPAAGKTDASKAAAGKSAVAKPVAAQPAPKKGAVAKPAASKTAAAKSKSAAKPSSKRR